MDDSPKNRCITSNYKNNHTGKIIGKNSARQNSKTLGTQGRPRAPACHKPPIHIKNANFKIYLIKNIQELQTNFSI
jgi:hypothetical protein